MKKKEKDLLKFIENSVDSSGDFSKISNKINFETRCHKKKNHVFAISFSAAFAVLIAIIFPIAINQLKSDNPMIENPDSEDFISEESIDNSILETAPTLGSDYNTEEVDSSVFETETAPVEDSNFFSIEYNNNMYNFLMIVNDESMIGQYLTTIDKYEIYSVNNESDNLHIIVKKDNQYYMLEKENN